MLASGMVWQVPWELMMLGPFVSCGLLDGALIRHVTVPVVVVASAVRRGTGPDAVLTPCDYPTLTSFVPEMPLLDAAVEPIAEEFLARLTTALSALNVGDPMDPATTHGPMSSEAALLQLIDQVDMICVAMPAEETMSIPIFDTVVKGISVIGSIVGTRQDVAGVFALHAAGRTKVIAETRKIDDVHQAMADVLSSRVPARLVFEF